MTLLTNSADGSAWQIDASGQIDVSGVLQTAIDYLANTYSGGILFVPPGVYLIRNTVTIKKSVIVQGSGNATLLQSQSDVHVMAFDDSCDWAGLRDCVVIGYANPNATTNVVTVAFNRPVFIRNCTIWGGVSALLNEGIDGSVEDCYITGWGFACLTSNGANWYRRCKFDADPGSVCQWSYYQGATVPGQSSAENHFEQCDFSGPWAQGSIAIEDAAKQAITVFDGCVMSNRCTIGGANWTSFVGCEFGGPVQVGSGTCSIVGSYAFTPFSVANASKAGNVNIT